MSEKHTPGPWFVSVNDDTDETVVRCNEDADYEPIICNCECDAAISVDHDGDEVSANARLIAAAPKLLDACEHFVAYHTAMVKGQINPDETSDAYESALIVIKDAIAEAEKTG